jgi:uncharacterized protein
MPTRNQRTECKVEGRHDSSTSRKSSNQLILYRNAALMHAVDGTVMRGKTADPHRGQTGHAPGDAVDKLSKIATTGVDGKERKVRREVMWSAWDEPGLGHLRLAVRDSGVVADGMVIGVTQGRAFRLAYEVRCDPYWRVRAARVGVPGEPPKVELLSDGEGNWTTPDGRAVMYLEGCQYVYVTETLFTNTLPIRRLGLSPGDSAEISVAYVEGTELQPWPELQRYTCLKKGDGGGLYRFESLDSGFTADLPVDADDLVLDYPGLFRRAFQE